MLEFDRKFDCLLFEHLVSFAQVVVEMSVVFAQAFLVVFALAFEFALDQKIVAFVMLEYCLYTFEGTMEHNIFQLLELLAFVNLMLY